MGLLQKYHRVGEWTVAKKLGEGQFAEVYEVKDSRDCRFAMKIEKRKDQKTVKQEQKVIRKLYQECKPFVCQVVDSGTWDERSYMVMELLGANLAEGRKHQAPHGRCDLRMMRHVALSTLDALQKVHEAGYIHRDVKPANFVLATPNGDPWGGRWVLIDFGLARRYVDESGSLLPERPEAAFRGSTSYASINAHHMRDQGRRDDLWSWLYVLVELLEGNLPWRSDKESEVQYRELITQRKQQCIDNPQELTRTVPLPEPLHRISDYLRGLSFSDAPNYAWLRQMLQQLPSSSQQLPSSSSSQLLQPRSPAGALPYPMLHPPGNYAQQPSPSAHVSQVHNYGRGSTQPSMQQPSPNGLAQYAPHYPTSGYGAAMQQPSPSGMHAMHATTQLHGSCQDAAGSSGYHTSGWYHGVSPTAHLAHQHQGYHIDPGPYAPYSSTGYGHPAALPPRPPLAETPASPIEEAPRPARFSAPVADTPASPPQEEDAAALFLRQPPHLDMPDPAGPVSSPLQSLATSPGLTPTAGLSSSRPASMQLLGKHSLELEQPAIAIAAHGGHVDAAGEQPTEQPPRKRLRSSELEPQELPRAPHHNGLEPSAPPANGVAAHVGGDAKDGSARMGQFVEFLQQGGASEAALAVVGGLRRLDPVEAVACIAWLLQTVAAGTEPGSAGVVASLLQDMTAFTQEMAYLAEAQQKQPRSRVKQQVGGRYQ